MCALHEVDDRIIYTNAHTHTCVALNDDVHVSSNSLAMDANSSVLLYPRTRCVHIIWTYLDAHICVCVNGIAVVAWTTGGSIYTCACIDKYGVRLFVRVSKYVLFVCKNTLDVCSVLLCVSNICTHTYIRMHVCVYGVHAYTHVCMYTATEML
jgi:hypothetical protein